MESVSAVPVVVIIVVATRTEEESAIVNEGSQAIFT